MPGRPLVLAFGALATELRAVLAASSLADLVEVRYAPANLHNRPERIVAALRELLEEHDPVGDRPVSIAYADCGTGGQLDAWLDTLAAAGRPVRRLPGSHCYEFFAGTPLFTALHDEDPGTFYLTDFLAKHFDAVVWSGLGLDRHPQLLDAYFGNYSRVVLFSQSDDPRVVECGAQAAARLGLAFEHHHVGIGPFSDAVAVTVAGPTMRGPTMRGAAR